MPTSAMKFLIIKAPATELRMILFKFGGGLFFAPKGYGQHNYIAGILLGPNPSLMIDTVGGRGDYAPEMAGHYKAGDLYTAWEYILLHFDKIPQYGVLILEQSAGSKYGWKKSELIDEGGEMSYE